MSIVNKMFLQSRRVEQISTIFKEERREKNFVSHVYEIIFSLKNNFIEVLVDIN